MSCFYVGKRGLTCFSPQIDRKSDKSYRRLLHEQMQLKKQIKSYRELTDEELLEMEASPSFGKNLDFGRIILLNAFLNEVGEDTLENISCKIL